MICKNCGKILEKDEVFCPACGIRAIVPETAYVQPPVTIQKTAAAQEEAAAVQEPAAPQPAPAAIPVPPPVYEMNYTRNEATGTVQYKAPPQPASTAAEYREPLPAEPEKEKEYFGKGALVLCLVVIGLLSASTGAFAGMYFSLLFKA